MFPLVFAVAFACIAMVGIQDVFAQTDLQRAQNLVTCLSGRYPRLCKREWLAPEELKKAEAAEHVTPLSATKASCPRRSFNRLSPLKSERT